MPPFFDNEGIRERRICSNCVGEVYLCSEINSFGEQGDCHYCGEHGNCFSIEDMAERVETAFEQHYYKTQDFPDAIESIMLADKESNYDWERSGEPVIYAIMNAADIPEEAASDIQKLLEEKHFDYDDAKMGAESEFAEDSCYEESKTSDAQWQYQWKDFEHSLKTEARFFSHSAMSMLTSVFEGIDSMRTREGDALIVDAGPGTDYSSIYRARTFQSQKNLKKALLRPDFHVGPPPSTQARSGRMNAHGISVFYGSNFPNVAIAEVRPPVGSQVVVAQFEITRPIRLLNLQALSEVTIYGSIFDTTLKERLERVAFLSNLSELITVPVMPKKETLEYLATQAIADFLATVNAPTVDGIIFPSAQVAGNALNFVLFHHAARVEEITLPEGAETNVQTANMTEYGWEEDYAVFEEIPPKNGKNEKEERIETFQIPSIDFEWENPEDDIRTTTLRIDIDTVCVHHVEAVQYSTTEHAVRRHRFEKGEAEF
jgi:hypothetical protein